MRPLGRMGGTGHQFCARGQGELRILRTHGATGALPASAKPPSVGGSQARALFPSLWLLLLVLSPALIVLDITLNLPLDLTYSYQYYYY